MTGLFRRAPWDAIRRVLAVRLDNAGDVVLLSPALAALRDALPEARITLLASRGGGAAAPLLECVDDVIVHESAWQQLQAGRVSPADERALVERLRVRRFDAALIFTSFSQTPVAAAYAAFLADIPVRAGFASQFCGQLLSHEVPAPTDQHQAERGMHLVRSLGIPVRDGRLRLRVPPAAEEEADGLLASIGLAGRPFALIAPGASAAARRYPAHRFGEVAHDLAERHGLPVVVTGAPDEAPLVQAVVESADSPRVHSFAGRTTLPVAAGLMARARVVVANNSLALHLADAFERPVVVTYSGSDPVDRWIPRSAPRRVLTRVTACAPCYHIDCPRALECLDIPPAAVVASAVDLLRSEGDLGADVVHEAVAG